MKINTWVLALALVLDLLGMASLASANDTNFPIANLYQVTPGFYAGGRPLSGGLEMLRQHGVKSVVNLQGGDIHSHFPAWIIAKLEPGELPAAIIAEGAKAQTLGMQYVSTPLDSLEDISPEEDRAIDQTLAFIANPNNQPVFVHCEHGQDRTGLIVALYAVKYLGISIEAAHQQMVMHGHDAIHQLFTHDLDEYFYQKVSQIRSR